MSGPRVSFDGVAKSYGEHVALDGISVNLESGSFVALVGTSGSGKSTLLKTINRLVEPDRGDVRIDGEPVGAVPPAALRRRIGYVFQNIGLFPHMSVADNIAIIPRLVDRTCNVVELLSMVGLPSGYADRAPRMLSGGEQQRVGIARALAGGPRLLLMDEPFGALDPVTRDALGTTIRALHDRLGLTTILVTHDMAEALLLADRVLVMERGRIVADATPHAMLAGDAGPAAAALVEVPRRQIDRLQRIAAA